MIANHSTEAEQLKGLGNNGTMEQQTGRDERRRDDAACFTIFTTYIRIATRDLILLQSPDLAA